MSKTDARWWLTEPKDDDSNVDVHTTIHPLAVRLAKRDGRRERLRAWRSIYMDEPCGSALDWYVRGERKARHNVVSNAVDALHARLSKAEPTPEVVTIGGKRDLQRRGKLMSQWLAGEFERLDVYRLGSMALLDSLVYGHGHLYTHTNYGRPSVELLWMGDLLADPVEEAHQAVRTMYRTVWVDRRVLQDAFPKHEKVLKTSKDPLDEEKVAKGEDSAADLVMVVEAWRLAFRDASDELVPGRMAITVDNATLRFVNYDKEYFPWVDLPWQVDTQRHFGKGMVESLAGIQSELNDITKKISDAYWLCAPSVWIPNSAGVSREEIGNTPWTAYNYNGEQPPVFNTPTGISQDFVVREETLIRRAYELRGISQLSAQSEKPAGLNSGKALTVHQDIESERFLPQQRRYERMYVELAKRLLDCAREILKEDSENSKRVLRAFGGDRMLEAVEFSDADLGDEDYRIRIEPVSQLSSSMAGRLNEVTGMMEARLITDTDEARELMQMPDLDRYNEIRSAPRDLANKLIEKALDGKRVTANPYMDLAFAHKQAVLLLNLEELNYDDDDDDTGLDMLRDLIGQIEALQTAAMPEPAPAPAAPPPMDPMADPAMGMAPPMPMAAGPIGV